MSKKIVNDLVSSLISEREAKELLKVSKNIEEDFEKLRLGYPVQYLIGYVDFYGNKIKVDERVLIPRYETEELCDYVIKYAKGKFNGKIDILDLCTGSGAIGITLKKNINSNVICSDISNDALEVARNNAKENSVIVDFVLSDLFENIEGKYNIIVSNPPYIAYDEDIMDSVRKYEPNNALYADDNGLYFYKKILSEASKYLKSNFIIAFEIGANQGKDIKRIAKVHFSNTFMKVEKDLSGRDRFFFIFSE